MARFGIAFQFISIFTLTGCAIHPLPEDWAGKDTRAIVRQLRCEAKEALSQQLADYFVSRKKFPKTVALGNKIKNERMDIGKITPEMIDSGSLRVIEDFARVGIGYSFRFQITEDNNKSVGTVFTLPFPNGTFTLGAGAGNARQRENERSVDVADTFRTIVYTLCKEQIYYNYIYPMTGKVGIGDVIDTYLNLREDILPDEKEYGKILNNGPEFLKNNGGSLKLFTDKLLFTTTFQASVSPKVVLNSVLNDFRLTEANGTLDNQRTDIHEVTIAMTPPAKDTTITKISLGTGVTLNIETLKIAGTKSEKGVAKSSQRRGGARRQGFSSITRSEEEATQEKVFQILQNQKAIGIQRRIEADVK